MIASLEAPRTFRAFAAIYLILLFIALVPLGLVSIPPLLDYPNHLARMHILLHGAEFEALQKFYRVDWAPYPNLAMELLVPAFAAVMPLEVAGRVFVGLTFVLISSGTAALHYVLHGRVSPWPLLVFLFLYNFTFLLGFLNYLFGVGIFLWALAAWIYLREKPYRLRLSVSSILALILYFSHLSALGLYGLAVFGYEVWRWRESGKSFRLVDGLAIAVPFLLPAFVFVFLSPTSGAFSFTNYGPVLNAIKHKVGALFSFASTYNIFLDGVTLWILSCVFVFGIVARTLKLAPPVRWPLILIALAYVVMPYWLLGGAGADSRLVIALVLVWIAGTSLNWRIHFWTRCITIALLAIFIVRIAVVAVHWKAADARYAEYVGAFDKMAEGSRLLAAYVTFSNDARQVIERATGHVASLAVITRSAYVPSMFTTPWKQPITVVAENRPPHRLDLLPTQLFVGERPKLASQPEPWNIWIDVDYLRRNWLTYDYLLLLNAKDSVNPMPSVLTPVYDGADFHLYKIRRTP